MANDDVVSARPAATTSSVAFLCGTAGFSDGFLAQGKKWAQAIQNAAGGAPQANLGDMTKDVAAVSILIARFSGAGEKGAIADPVLDGTLGGLRGHTLIFVTHGLEPHDPNLTPQEKDRTQGLLFFNQSKGDDPKDRVLTKLMLDFMVVQPGANGQPDQVVEKPDLATILDDADGIKFKKDVRDFAPVVGALRRSVFGRVYLAACGGGRRLEKFAARLRDLTGKEVYWNDDTISMPTPPTAPFAEVGQIVNGAVPNLRKGTRYFKAVTDPANLVDLRTKTNTFFEGSMSRLP